MRRLQIMGLCVIAACAVAAIIASSASAAVPTWYECAKAPKIGKEKTGDYNDKLCTSPNAEGKGAYVLQEGVARDKRFKGKSGTAVLHVQTFLGDEMVTCKKSIDAGVPKLPNREGGVEIVLQHCVAQGKKCTSAGEKAGFIRLHALTGELGYLEESPVVVGIRLELESEPGGVIASFDCEGLEASVSGALIGVQQKDIDAINKESEVVFTAAENLGTVEFEGHEFAPLVNALGWASEAESIAKHETAPHVLSVKLCGVPVEAIFHEPCAPEAYAGEDATSVSKGGMLMIKTS